MSNKVSELSLSPELRAKYERLRARIKAYGALVVAFSGGVDSTLLLRVATDLLGDRAVGVTATSSTYPKAEFDEALALARSIGARHVVIESEELDLAEFANNPPDRCYFCKRELFSKLLDIARKERIPYVADGTNADDETDYRPGTIAADELGVVCPLKEAGLTKPDIRALSKALGLPTWDKPAYACLSSRFPYGERITRDGLAMVEATETFLHDLGFRQVRVRHHGTIARIEVSAADVPRLLDDTLRHDVVHKLKSIGYTYVTVDLEGYRTGSMNEPLEKRAPAKGGISEEPQ